MLVALVRPRIDSHLPVEPPLGLLSLAAHLRSTQPETQTILVDGHLDDLGPAQIIERLAQLAPAVVGLSYTTQGAPAALDMVCRIRNHPTLRRIPIIAGGPHATALPAECLAAGATVCVLGEGEATLCELLHPSEGVRLGPEIRGIAYLDGGGTLRRTPARPRLTPEQFPEPSLDLVELGRYGTEIHAEGERALALPVMASRGCAYRCTFCASALTWGRRVRRRAARDVVEQLRRAMGEHGISDFHFYDDDFFGDDGYLREFVALLKQTSTQIRFTCLATCSSLLACSEATIGQLKDAGLTVLEVGIESLLPEVLHGIDKPQGPGDIEAVAAKLRRLGVDVCPLLMYMNPFETLAGHQRQTERFWELFGWSSFVRRCRSYPDTILFEGSTCTPFPGTPLFRKVSDFGMLLTRAWDEYDSTTVVFLPYSLLEDIPYQIENRPSEHCRQRFATLCTRATKSGLPADLDGLLDALWAAIDGKRSLRELGAILQRQFPTQVPHKLLVAACVGTLVLLLNGQHIGARG